MTTKEYKGKYALTFKQKILQNANAIYSLEKITFTYYRIVDGIRNTLEKIRTGIKHLLPNAQC